MDFLSDGGLDPSTFWPDGGLDVEGAWAEADSSTAVMSEEEVFGLGAQQLPAAELENPSGYTSGHVRLDHLNLDNNGFVKDNGLTERFSGQEYVNKKLEAKGFKAPCCGGCAEGGECRGHDERTEAQPVFGVFGAYGVSPAPTWHYRDWDSGPRLHNRMFASIESDEATSCLMSSITTCCESSMVSTMVLDNPGCDNFPDTVCTTQCCAFHDECYDLHDCSWWSWLWTLFLPTDCAWCNVRVTRCINACVQDALGQAKLPFKLLCDPLHMCYNQKCKVFYCAESCDPQMSVLGDDLNLCGKVPIDRNGKPLCKKPDQWSWCDCKCHRWDPLSQRCEGWGFTAF